MKSIDQHNWYGFWDFGDVMHPYDPIRSVWRYDLGGMAWDNSELGTDLWMWYSFLRSGRADMFRMAEAMTRHTGEVDCYHLGELAGPGSRHNVRHWGCGAKEARISQAGYRRYYTYLTTDERTGDIMRATLEADFAATRLDPMRIAQPITEAEKAVVPGLWMQYCRLYEAPKEVLLRDMETGREGADARYAYRQQGGPRLAGYVYMKTGNKAFGEEAIRQLVSRRGAATPRPETISGSAVLKPIAALPTMSTNDAAQSGLNMIEVLEMCADILPHDLPKPESPPTGSPRRRAGGG